MTHDVLLTVSGHIPADLEAEVAAGKRPEPDYIVIGRAFPADIADYTVAAENSDWFGRLLGRINPRLQLTWYCYRQRDNYKVIFTDGEQIGLPLAFLLKFLPPYGRRKVGHLMIVHILSTKSKRTFVDLFRLQTHIDRFLVYSSLQRDFIRNRWQLPAEQVPLTTFMVNDDYFNPAAAVECNATLEIGNKDNRPFISSVGLERRDYPTLIEAVEGIDVHLVVAAGSPWSRRSDPTAGEELPPNVTRRRFTFDELREVYAASRFFVMPLYDVDFQAGITAILEAMAMGKAVICSRIPGQTDAVIEGVNGLYVPPEDPAALREAIIHLLDNPQKAAEMGEAGRKFIEEKASLKQYVARLKKHTDDVREQYG